MFILLRYFHVFYFLKLLYSIGISILPFPESPSITVLNGWAVQSIGYSQYLPLGRPSVIAENLDRWGADEILIQCIDRSASQNGPDYKTLSELSAVGINTPLISGLVIF